MALYIIQKDVNLYLYFKTICQIPLFTTKRIQKTGLVWRLAISKATLSLKRWNINIQLRLDVGFQIQSIFSHHLVYICILCLCSRLCKKSPYENLNYSDLYHNLWKCSYIWTSEVLLRRCILVVVALWPMCCHTGMPCRRRRTWHSILLQYTDTGPTCHCAIHWCGTSHNYPF